MENVAVFRGFTAPEENWSRLPHALIDALPIFESLAELKVVLYVLRHTWGFHEYDRPKHITLDELQHGRKTKDGARMDGGTGLAKSTIIDGIKRAVKHGFMVVLQDNQDKARQERYYGIRMYESQTPENPEVVKSDTGGSEVVQRTEKETPEINQEKESESLPPVVGNPQSNLPGLQPDVEGEIISPSKVPPKVSPVRPAKADPHPWSALTKAMHEATPADIRPLKCFYAANDNAAEACFKAGLSPADVTAFTTDAYANDPWIRGQNKDGQPIPMYMSYIAKHFNGWKAKGNHAANGTQPASGGERPGGSDRSTGTPGTDAPQNGSVPRVSPDEKRRILAESDQRARARMPGVWGAGGSHPQCAGGGSAIRAGVSVPEVPGAPTGTAAGGEADQEQRPVETPSPLVR